MTFWELISRIREILESEDKDEQLRKLLAELEEEEARVLADAELATKSVVALHAEDECGF